MSFIDTAYALELPEINPLGADAFGSDVGNLLLFIIRGMLFIAGALAVIYIIWSGYTYITSAGDPERAQKGRNGLIYAIIGIIIIGLSFAIVGVVDNTLNKGIPNSGNSQGPGTGQQQPGEGTRPAPRPGELPRAE